MPFGPGTLEGETVTIKSGQQLSGPIDLDDHHFLQFAIPAGMTGTVLAFYGGGFPLIGSDTSLFAGAAALAAVTPVPAYGDDGVALSMVVPAGGDVVGISGDKMSKLCGGRFLWLKSNAGGGEAADAVIGVSIKQ